MAITTADTEELGNAYVSAMWGDADEHVVLAMALGKVCPTLEHGGHESYCILTMCHFVIAKR